MSTANVHSFLEKAASDPDLRAKLENQPPSSLDEIISLATTHGLPFTAEDWQACAGESSSLSDAELSEVSGGNAWLDGIHRLQQRRKDNATLNLGPEKA